MRYIAKIRPGAALGLAAAMFAGVGTGASASVGDFYKTTPISIYIGSTPGGGYDQYGRLLGRHMGRHVPGNPSFVPKNMPGASSRRALGFIYDVAPKDGSALGIVIRGTLFDPLLYPEKGLKIDPTKLTWIGSANSEVTTCVTWHTTGITSLDGLRTKGMIVGASGPNSTDAVFSKLLNEIAGTRIKVIHGYPGSTQVHLAMERGEVDGRCGLGWDSVVARLQHWLENKKINIVLQLAMKKHKDLPHVPFAMDLARNEQDRQVMELLFSPNLMGRPFFGPPGIPSDRVQALRAAFSATTEDPKFLSEAGKLEVAIDPLTGEEMGRLVNRIYGMPDKVVQAARTILTSTKGLSQRVAKYYTVDAKLVKTNKKGSRIRFMEKGKEVEASVSGQRTEVMIAGQKAKRSALKAGMSCAITYEGHKTQAKSVACK